MRQAAIISAFGHLLLVAVGYFGIPALREEPLLSERVIIVEMVAITEERNLPQTVIDDTEPEEPKTAEQPPPPPPEPPEPEPEVVTLPEPEPEPAAEPEPEPVETVSLPKEVKRPRGKPKPKPKPDPFADVLKSVEELEKKRQTREPDDDAKTTPPDIDPIEQALAQANTPFSDSIPLSMSEIDNIRYQIQRNWSLPAGARDAQNMVVTLRIQLNPDGTVTGVSVLNESRMRSDPFFRAMAESTVRAVLKTDRIKNLSPEKYELWRDMRINFDPREMFS